MVKDRELLTQLLLCFIDEPEKVDALVENLLNRRGSLRYLCETSLDQLNKVEGLPPNAAFLLANFQGILTAERLSLLEHKPLSRRNAPRRILPRTWHCFCTKKLCSFR